MKIDPNRPPIMSQEHVLCESDRVVMFDDSTSSSADLDNPNGAFMRFLKTLDPNTSFVVAFVDADDQRAREFFYRARDVAWSIDVSMQGTLQRYGAQLQAWEAYKQSKRFSNAEEGQ